MRTLAVTLAALTFAGCGFSTSSSSQEQSFEVDGTPRIFITSFNGSIHAQPGAVGEVRFSSIRRGDGITAEEAEHDLDNIEVVTRREGNDVFIEARRLDRSDDGSADINLTFPEGAALEIRTGRGEISVRGAGALLARTNDGMISAVGLTGNADLQSGDGGIEVGSKSPILVSAITTNGLLRHNGPLAEGRNVFRTTNNRLELSLPAESAFNLSARTTNGGISVDFPIRHEGGTSTDHVRGAVGENPKVNVEAETSNGRITIRRG